MTVLRLTPAMGTHVGMRRRHNEDAIGYQYPVEPDILQQSGALFIVADGVGGLSAGERASNMAVTRLKQYYYEADSKLSVAERLATAFQQTNSEIYNFLHDPGRPTATTLVAAVIINDELIAASVGDSLIFLVRDDEITQLNEEDVLTDGSAEDGALTKAIGYRDTVEVETISGSVQPGDVIVLCSDGLTRYVSLRQLVQFARMRDPRDSVRRMINEANTNGGGDNISAVVVQIGEALAADEVAKHIQRLSIPVAIDSQPLMTPDVPVKPTTSIPLTRPEPQLPETIFPPQTPSRVSVPEHESKPQRPKDSRSKRKQNGRNWMVIAAIVILIVGAVVFFGALLTLTSKDNLATATPGDIVTEPAQTADTESISPTDTLLSATVPAGTVVVGDSVIAADSIVTLARVGDTVGSFVTAPDTAYLVEEIFEDDEGQLWYRLLDEASGQSGWISASSLASGE